MSLRGSSNCLVVATLDGVIVEALGDTNGVCGWNNESLVGERLVSTIIPRHYRMAHIAGLTEFGKTGKGAVLGKTIPIRALGKSEQDMPIYLTVFAASNRIYGFMQQRREK